MRNRILDISSINGFGYSYIDWEYAKRKQKEPDITFDDILKESMDKLDSELIKLAKQERKSKNVNK